MKWLLIILINTIPFLELSGQINVNVELIGGSKFKIKYENIDSVGYVIWLHDWKILNLEDHTKIPHWFYKNSRLLNNYLIVHQDSFNVIEKLWGNSSYLSIHQLNPILYAYPFKHIEPNEKFELEIAIKDHEIDLSALKNIQGSYFYSYCKASRLASFSELDEFFFSNEKLEFELEGSEKFNLITVQSSNPNTLEYDKRILDPLFLVKGVEFEIGHK